MTYDEIKKRLTEVETALQSMQNKKSAKLETSYTAKSIGKLTTIKESLEKQLAEKDETMFISTKGGDTKAVAMDRKTAMDLKKDPNITGIDTAKGQKIKEQEGIEFDQNETGKIAVEVGKALAMALKKAGDELARMKAKRIEPNSFDIHIVYKGEKGEDEFSFYITDDSLHLVDFSFDKELVDVGVKPSGEAIVNKDVLANELLKHFKSLNEEQVNEVNYDYYTEPKHFDICPGAEALRDELIDNGKTPEELGEWTYRHDQLFKLEKDVLKSKYANIKHVNAANKLRDEIIHLSRDLGIDADKVHYLKGHVDKIQDVRMGKDVNEGEGDDHHYIKVPRREYKSAMQILNRNAEPSFVKMDTVDDDGMGNVIIYFMFNEFADDFDVEEREAFMYDAVEDLKAHGIDVQDHSAQLDEARDYNDPVMVRLRAARMDRDKFAGSDPKAGSTIKSRGFDPIILKLKAKRAQIMRDMEQEAEPEGGPIADKYGDMLNKIDAAIAKARGIKEGQPTVFDNESFDALRDIILKYVEDPDDAEKLVQQVDDHGLDSLPDDLEAQLERDPEFEAWYNKLHSIPDADTDYMQRRRAEKDYMEEDTDVGHQDDEPGMLKSTSYEIATYAAKLYKKLAKYDQVDGEVDFPNWWQSKLILAKDYVSKAYHYLDSEEKQPIIDKLALEHALKESTDLYDRNGIQITRFAGKEGRMVQINYGGRYIHISAEEYPFLVRAMQSVQGDLKDLSVQFPRPKNMGEALDSDLPKNLSAAKLQKAHGMIVDKMKELAKLYKEKGGDHEYRGHSVMDHLRSLTKKKKQVEAALEKAVANIGKGQELTEVTKYEVDDAIAELGEIIRDIDQKADEAREIVRKVFPNELSRLDAYGAFNGMHSANRYDVTLGGFVDRLEEEGYEIEDGEVFTLEGDYKSDAQRKAIYAAKAEKEKKNESFKVGDKVTYLGHPGEITKVNKEMTGAITYNVAYDKGNGRTKATNIYNKGGEIKAVKEALQLVHVYDKDGKMYGTGSVEKVEGGKTTVRFDGSTVKRFPSDRVKPVKEAELSKAEKKKLKDMSKSLKKSSKGHAGQAKYLDKITKEAAPGYKHDCASKVIHKEYGAGTCIPEKHTLVKEGNKYVVTHYDVLFESGKTVTDIPVSELEIKTQTEHWHKGYKKKKK